MPLDAFNAELDLKLERVVDAPLELVWRCWTEPEHLEKWFTPVPWRTSDAKIDLRPGGAFGTRMTGPAGESMYNEGCYLRVVPQQKLVFTDALGPGFRPKGTGFMTATILLERAGSGTRYVALVTHATAEARKQHEDMGFSEGWGKALEQLVEHTKTMV